MGILRSFTDSFAYFSIKTEVAGTHLKLLDINERRDKTGFLHM